MILAKIYEDELRRDLKQRSDSEAERIKSAFAGAFNAAFPTADNAS